MRIGLFTDTYLPVANGICYVIEILRRDLVAEGHDVWVVAPKDWRWHLPREPRVIRYRALRGLFYQDQFNSFFWPPRQLKKIKELNLDVIIAFTPSYIGGLGAYASVQLGIPYVIHYGTDLEEYGAMYKPTVIGGLLGSAVLAPYLLRMSWNEIGQLYRGYFGPYPKRLGWYRYVTRHMLSALHERAEAVIAPSEKIAGKLKQWPIAQNIAVIPTGVDSLPASSEFKKQFMTKYGLTEEDEIILYAGRLSIEKNLGVLIESFDTIGTKRPKAKLLLVGDFQHRKHLEAKAAAGKYKERIIFAGQVSRQELGAVYALADIFTFPSLTDCQALVLNEAALAGLPLVWCDEPGLNPILVNKKTGLKAINEPKAYGQAVTTLLENRAQLAAYGQEARRRAETFSEKAQTKKLADFLNQLV
ncbi:MAG TPA: glycosyltransferase [Candidatus Saccharimonadales bacterium]|nr:glycosyltransferase [Candidatus Saccharimonadales bacterium]